MRKYDFVVFDMDGTLVDSYETHYKIFDYYFSRYHTGFPIKEALEKKMGASMLAIFKETKMDDSYIKEVLDDLYDFYYSDECEKFYEPLIFVDGAKETIKKIKDNGIPVAMISNSNYSFVSKIAERNGMIDEFEIIIGSDSETYSKAENFRLLLDKEGVPPERVLYIGDYEGDIIVSRECNIDCCILYTPISWAKSPENLLKDPAPDFIIRDINRVATIAL